MKRFLRNWFRRFGIDIKRIKGDSIKYNPASFIGENKKEVKKQFLKVSGHSVFFGYHDKTPFSLDGKKILANSVEGTGTTPEKECTKMDVGFFQKRNGSFTSDFNKIAETHTWSWQQGCMLQWNPTFPDDQVYFNTLVDDKHGSVLFDLNKRQVLKKYNYPIYSMTSDGKYASSINFGRLAKLRSGYGYRKYSSQKTLHNVPEDDGIFLIDLEENKTDLLISLKDLTKYTDEQVPHYINHVRFSPSGDKILFFHIHDDNYKKRFIHFYLYDRKLEQLELLNSTNMVSHFCWKNEDEIFASELGDGHTRYYIYNLQEQSKKELKIAKIGDVHPMFSPADPNLIVLDTKPDVNRDQHLFVFNIENKSFVHLGKFRLPKNYTNEVRCDLHPRWDRSGNLISIDTVTKGFRSMTIINTQN